MNCPVCAHENDPDARFCVNCGSALGLTCPNCGSPVHRGQNFCSNCGHDLRGEPAGSGPSSYTPKHLAERILADRHALVGERKRVTVMFADIVDSTATIEGSDPEDAAGFLSGALDGMMESIHQFEGTVNELRGDGLMALFGAPIAHEDHAIRASLAALAIPDAVAGATGGKARTRVGLHTGEVLLRGVGNDLSVEYQAIGPTVHLAARMESLAEPGTAFVTSDVDRLIAGFVETAPQGPVPVKGISEPVEVFRLERTRSSSPWQARSRGGLTAFTGRNEELARMQNALDQIGTGAGRVVALIGEAGLGKSRLVHEFLEGLDPEVFSILKAEAFPFESNTAYFPIKTLVEEWLGPDSEAMAPSDRVRLALEVIGPDLTETIPAFTSVLGEEPDDVSWLELSPQKRQRFIRDSIKAVLRVMAERKPLVIVIEDLHWIDGETTAIIEEVVAMAPRSRMLLVVTYRPEFNAAWAGAAGVDNLRLSPLSPEHAINLLDHMMGDDPAVTDLKPRVASRAEGIPLFLEETVRSLVESGTLRGSRGEYRLAADAGELDIPDSIQAILAARIDRLDPDDKRVLQVASVAGQDVPVSLIAGVIDRPEQQIVEALGRLQDREFVYEHRTLPEIEFRFGHALMRDVAYASLPRTRRRDMHRDIVKILEEADVESPPERLAYHAHRAQLWDETVHYSLAAADRSIAASAFREASTFLRAASGALENLPQDDHVIKLAIDVRMRLRVAETGARGGLARLLADLEETSRMAEELGDLERQARVAIHYGYTANMMGKAPLANRLADEAHRRGQELGSRYVIAESQLLLAQSLIYSGAPGEVPGLLSPHVEYLTREIRHETMDQTMIRSVVACAHFAVAECAAGHFAEGLRWVDEGAAIADEANRPFDRMYMQFALGKCLDLKGETVDAIEAHQRSLAIADENDIWFMKTFARPWHGHALHRAGRLYEALDLLQATEQVARDEELPFVVAECQAFIAGVAADMGDPELARISADAAMAFGTENDIPLFRMSALRATGRTAEAAQLARASGYLVWAEGST